MRQFRASILLILIILSVTWTVDASTRHLERDELTGHIGSTREEILVKRERRKGQFGGKLEELYKQMEAHTSGEVPLPPASVARLEKKIKAYEHKLNYYEESDTEEVRPEQPMSFAKTQVRPSV